MTQSSSGKSGNVRVGCTCGPNVMAAQCTCGAMKLTFESWQVTMPESEPKGMNILLPSGATLTRLKHVKMTYDDAKPIDPNEGLTDEHRAFIKAIAADPKDQVVKNVFADWLEEKHGDLERAAKLRAGGDPFAPQLYGLPIYFTEMVQTINAAGDGGYVVPKVMLEGLRGIERYWNRRDRRAERKKQRRREHQKRKQ